MEKKGRREGKEVGCPNRHPPVKKITQHQRKKNRALTTCEETLVKIKKNNLFPKTAEVSV